MVPSDDDRRRPVGDRCRDRSSSDCGHRLVERGARTTLFDAAGIGLLDRVQGYFTDTTTAAPTPEEVSRAFWGACHGGHLSCARYLLDHGADINWIPPWARETPLEAAGHSGNPELVTWLHLNRAHPAEQLGH